MCGFTVLYLLMFCIKDSAGFSQIWENILATAKLLEAQLALTHVKYHDNLEVLIQHNQWLALTMLRATRPRSDNLPFS